MNADGGNGSLADAGGRVPNPAMYGAKGATTRTRRAGPVLHWRREALRGPAGGRRSRPRGAARRVLRAAGTERRRQDHDHRDSGGAARAGRRPGADSGPRVGPERRCVAGAARDSPPGVADGREAVGARDAQAVSVVLSAGTLDRGTCSGCSSWAASARAGSASCRAVSDSVWPSDAPWSAIPTCCSSTSRPPGWTPQSRRQLWALLQRYRADGGTILLTTHYMDEATRSVRSRSHRRSGSDRQPGQPRRADPLDRRAPYRRDCVRPRRGPGIRRPAGTAYRPARRGHGARGEASDAWVVTGNGPATGRCRRSWGGRGPPVSRSRRWPRAPPPWRTSSWR